MTKRSAACGALLAVAWLAASCASPSQPPPAPPSAPPSSPPPSRSPVSSPPAVTSPLPGSNTGGGDQQAAVEAAVQDAAAHLGVGRDTLQVARVEARQWGDSSLGCPRPGVQYLQVVMAGFLIVVTDGTRTLEYHADNRGRVVLCQES